jgi:hypothetical protein
MHKEVLTKEQIELLPLIKSFSKDFFLVGGTAIAFHLGHRHSVDFDLFTDKKFSNLRIERQVSKFFEIEKTFVSRLEEYTILVNKVRITFFQYPFKIDSFEMFKDIIKIPDLLTLAAMKAYALGQRAKWKDYVDMYYIIKDHFSVKKISKRAEEIFKGEFNEKLFRSQLAYFKDIDYSEEIIYLDGYKVDNKIIERALIDFSLSKI